MHTLTSDELNRQPQQLIDDARRGEPALVLRDGEPVFMSVPLGKGMASEAVCLEFAVNLYGSAQISLGVAARIAGLAYSEMIDELGRCGMAVIHLEPGELERELAAFGA